MSQTIRLINIETMDQDNPENAILSYVRQNARQGSVLRDPDVSSIVSPTFEGEEDEAVGRRERRETASDILSSTQSSGKIIVQWRAKDIEIPIAESISKESEEEVQQSLETSAFVARPGQMVPGSITGAQARVYSADLDEFWWKSRDQDQNQIPVLRIINDNQVGQSQVVAATTDFLLQDISEPRSEKFQIYDTFGRSFIFFFGKRPEIYTYSGVLLNSRNFDWKRRFLSLYENYLRGTKSVEQKIRVRMSYEDVVREGYILSANISYSQSYLHYVLFNFTMFITRSINVGPDVRDAVEEDRAANEPAQDKPIQANVDDAQDIQGNDNEALRNEIITKAKNKKEGSQSLTSHRIPRTFGAPVAVGP